MAVRDGMTDIISELRQLTATVEGESTLNGTELWTDEQLQDVLDRYRRVVRALPLQPIQSYESGSLVYQIYPLPTAIRSYRIENSSDAFEVLNSTMIKQAFGVSYTLNIPSNQVEFLASTGGRTYYANMLLYDINLAAADIWDIKASLRWDSVDWRTDNHTISEGDEYEHCVKQALYFRSRAIRSTKWVRTDEAPRMRSLRS